ncbi:hypothetical protein N865_02800 [Intrasporangium oryzae NRRL B-24470]|uniref:Uncharacterized protein n=1 Tax=Intrasporangium oryzae NRRL B-24470 TaxID=1386089 RepID=W9GCQ8_9MICO|nr:hypothetical protein [Intrasporangium oryzae]EWT02603.1 hypothetical protein N865_02800 [Intrasporangium oryzae NRRL B-24470]
MITHEGTEKVRGWFTGRLPEEWKVEPPEVTVDREEITIVLTVADVDLPDGTSDAERSEARAGRAKAFREDTRKHRIEIAREAEHRFDRKVSWAVRVGDRTELFTHVAAPAMTRLRQPERLVLDTLVEAGVARSRAEALAWCVKLVGQHESDWLDELRGAMSHVEEVRKKGPGAA